MGLKPTVTITNEWKAFLADVDRALSQEFTLRCLGGFALSAMYGLPRPTADMDYIEIAPLENESELVSVAGRESKLAKKHGFYIQRTGIAKYPDGFESRIVGLGLGLHRLNVYILGPYDLALSKVCTDRPKDMEDAKYLIKIAALELNEFIRIWTSEMAYQLPSRFQTDINIAKDYFQR